MVARVTSIEGDGHGEDLDRETMDWGYRLIIRD
jgi:hypothetical protein